jgi:hypothetical protein
MKNFKKLVLLTLISVFTTVNFTACSADDELSDSIANSISSYDPVQDVQVMESGYMSTEVTAEALTRAANSELSPEDIKVTQLTEEQARAFDANKDGKGGYSKTYMYRWVTLRYKSNTANGTKQDLSELVVWPYLFGDRSPKNLIIGCHSTITSNKERPSNFSEHGHMSEMNMLALFAHGLSKNALVIIPDYEGYGSTVASPHPYCNRELTAEQVVTGAKAGLNWFENKITKMNADWASVAIGYSQGGAVAAGVLRYCQQHHEDGLRLKGAVCGDGPYDPLATLKRYISMNQLYMPVAPALLLKGMVDTDKDMKQLECRYEDFVTKQFFQTGIFDMIQSKQHTTDDIQAALLRYSYQHGDEGGFTMMAETSDGFKPYTPKHERDANGRTYSFKLKNGKGYNYCTVDQCFKPGVIAYFRDGKVTGDVPEAKLKALEKALARNALTAGDFKPDAGFTFFHSVGDEVVPYCNIESVRNTWGTSTIKSVTYRSHTTFHVGTGTPFFGSYCGNLVGEILNGKWQPCDKTVGGYLW